MVECKRGQFELFGFDIMLDQEFNSWLIEVNSSPSLDYSTHVTESLVKRVLPDIIKVVIDYGWAPFHRRKNIDTGGWKCIFRRNQTIDKP